MNEVVDAATRKNQVFKKWTFQLVLLVLQVAEYDRDETRFFWVPVRSRSLAFGRARFRSIAFACVRLRSVPFGPVRSHSVRVGSARLS